MKRVEGPLYPKIQKKINNITNIANECEVDWSRDPQSYVVCPSMEYVVNLTNYTCACRRWKLSCILCAHAVAAIKSYYNNP